MKLWALMLLWVAAGAGCASSNLRVSLETPARPPPASEYVDELKKWTRSGHILADFDEALTVNGTFRSPEFRAAYAEKWIKTYFVGPDESARTRERLMSEGADTWEFHVESSAHRWEINDFSSKKSIWRLALVDDTGREVTAKDVLATTARRELEMEFYPYANIFSRGWTLRFPKTLADGTPLVRPDTKSVTLRFAGPMGVIDLVWLLK
jgi:hypothetical protein